MATILEIATEAGATAEQVIRVVNGEPVSEDVAARVRAAMAMLGRPAYPLPAAAEQPRPALGPASGDAGLLGRVADAAAELESTLPAELGTVVYEALRLEVRPVARHVAGLETLAEALATELRSLRREVAAERRDRVDDLALQIDLLRTSWASVDRRLGRIERALARERTASEPPRTALTRIDKRPQRDSRPAADGA